MCKNTKYFAQRKWEIASMSNPATNAAVFGLSFDKFGTPSCL